MSLVFKYGKTMCLGSSVHPIKFKRKRGTFTLHSQAVLRETISKITEVMGIRVNEKGIKEGRIKFNGDIVRVVQYGKGGWCKK